MIGKKTSKTFFSLLHDTNMTVKDLAKLVEINGVHYVSRWGDWEAATPSDPNGKEAIEAALEELATFGSALATNDSTYMNYFYECQDNHQFHPLHAFGFNLGEAGDLLVDEKPLMSLADKIEDLEAQLSNAQEETVQLSNQVESLSKAAEAAKLKAEELDSTSPISDLRAIAIHTWLKSNSPSTRVELWNKMHEIDPTLFGKPHSKSAVKTGMDRINSAHEKRYNERIQYPDGVN